MSYAASVSAAWAFFQFQGRSSSRRCGLNRYLRKLLVVGALSVIQRAKQAGSSRHPWLVALMARRSTKVAAIALANKIARFAWAMMVRGTRYKEPHCEPGPQAA